MMNHWLAAELTRLQALAVEHAREKTSTGVPGHREEAQHRSREAFLAATRSLVAGISERRGVTACFVSHDGLLADYGGKAPDFEALAAVAQKCQAVGREAGASLSLGGVRQMVVVGDEHKLAMLLVGQLVIGILCPVDTSLGELLGR